MQTRKLGNSDLHITPVGYGAWAVGGSGWQFGWGSQNDNDSITAIHRSLEIGVNWIDTAAVYGLGHSEEIVARALTSWSGPRPYVFTKCGLRWDANGQVQKVLSADSIRGEVEDSLARRRMVHASELTTRRQGALDRRFELQCRSTASRPGYRSGHIVAAPVFTRPPGGGRRDSTLLPTRRDWSHRLFPNGFRPADRRHDS